MNNILKALRAQAHKLNPVVIIGAQGLTPAVNAEINRALIAHELIKIRVNANTREERDALIKEICSNHQAILVNRVGHIAAIYKKAEDCHPENA